MSEHAQSSGLLTEYPPLHIVSTRKGRVLTALGLIGTTAHAASCREVQVQRKEMFTWQQQRQLTSSFAPSTTGSSSGGRKRRRPCVGGSSSPTPPKRSPRRRKSSPWVKASSTRKASG